MSKSLDLLGVSTDFLEQGNDLVRKHTQNISQAFLDDLKDSRNASTSGNSGEFMRAASIPVAVIEQWTREGFNIYEATGKRSSSASVIRTSITSWLPKSASNHSEGTQNEQGSTPQALQGSTEPLRLR